MALALGQCTNYTVMAQLSYNSCRACPQVIVNLFYAIVCFSREFGCTI